MTSKAITRITIEYNVKYFDNNSFFLLPTANPGIGSDVIQRPAAGQGASNHNISLPYFIMKTNLNFTNNYPVMCQLTHQYSLHSYNLSTIY